jgi:predicted metal-dependent phosphoesterase TrpH
MIDLHIHSNFSDGTDSPKEIISIAKGIGIEAISITDHNCIEAEEEGRYYAEKYKIKYLNGVELTSTFKNRKIHILAYGFDSKNPNFVKPYSEIKAARAENIEYVLKVLKEQNIDIDKQELRKVKNKKDIDRFDILRYLINNGYCKTTQEVWNNYLNRIKYNEGEVLDYKTVLRMVKDSSGVAVLAHFNKKIGFGGGSLNDIELNLKDLLDSGLDGVERYYPTYSTEENLYLDKLINKYDLIVSGGTDYHGRNRPKNKMGIGIKDMCIPFSVYEKIIEINHKYI